MAPGALPGTDVRVRRARRQDLPRLAPLLRTDAGTRRRRFFRRLLADLGTDVYVAEAADGSLLGVVAVAYLRSLAEGGTTAVLDLARVLPGVDAAVLDALLDVAAARAQRRGCLAVHALGAAGDPALDAALRARGWLDAPGLVRAAG